MGGQVNWALLLPTVGATVPAAVRTVARGITVAQGCERFHDTAERLSAHHDVIALSTLGDVVREANLRMAAPPTKVTERSAIYDAGFLSQELSSKAYQARFGVMRDQYVSAARARRLPIHAERARRVQSVLALPIAAGVVTLVSGAAVDDFTLALAPHLAAFYGTIVLAFGGIMLWAFEQRCLNELTRLRRLHKP